MYSVERRREVERTVAESALSVVESARWAEVLVSAHEDEPDAREVVRVLAQMQSQSGYRVWANADGLGSDGSEMQVGFP